MSHSNMQTNNKKKTPVWEEKKARLLGMSLEERRKEYHREYVALENILTWRQESQRKSQSTDEHVQDPSNVNDSLSSKVALYRGDITMLEIDAIVNAANTSLLGGGGVDGCIHRAAGSCLLAECRTLNGCETGQAKITSGYDLPAKYVIHTVGPIARGHVDESHKRDLLSCYKTSLDLLKEYKLRSIAFPCISTGIYGFPNEPAADIALKTVKDWLKENGDEIDCIIFCVFLEVDFKIYKRKMNEFFPTVEETVPKAQSPPPKKHKNKTASDEDSDKDEEANDVCDVEMASQSQALEAVKESSPQKHSSEEADSSDMTMSQEPSQSPVATQKVEKEEDGLVTERELPIGNNEESVKAGETDPTDSQVTDMDTETTEKSSEVTVKEEEQQFAEFEKSTDPDFTTSKTAEADSVDMNSQLDSPLESEEVKPKEENNEAEEQ